MRRPASARLTALVSLLASSLVRRLAAPLVLSCFFALGCKPATPEHPNLIMILGDDHGYPYSGFMGSALVKTPQLDRLAAEGSLFPVAYNTASLCLPSQISLLTGLDPTQWRGTLEHMQAQGQPLERAERVRHFATLPRILGQQGYATLQAGKLWEGVYDSAGFSDGTKTATAERSLRRWAGGKASLAIGRSSMQPVYDFIDANRDRPFYIWLAPQLPHHPYDPPERFLELYADAKLSDSARLYYANISRLDAIVGDVLAKLEEHGLRESTLVVYLSDNGLEQGPDDDYGAHSSGGPRGKGSLHELGHRTPMIFSWPGQIEAGARLPALVSTLDLFHTLLDYAGVEPLADRAGKSLRPLLEGRVDSVRDALLGSNESGNFPPRRQSPQSESPTLFLRDQSWHYLWSPDSGAHSLYDMRRDPEELHDVAAEHPELLDGFRARMLQWRAEMARPIEPGPPIRRR